MKYIAIILFLSLFGIASELSAQTQVTYSLSYDAGTATYTVSMTSNTSFSPPLSRLTSSSQVTLVVPDGWAATNIINLTDLSWGLSPFDGATEGLSDDYLFFAPSNAGTYNPFVITGNIPIPLFSFQSSVGCIGGVSIYDNTNDPLNGVPTVNGDNNVVILGAGPGSVFDEANTSVSDVLCTTPCAADAGSLSY